MTAFGRVAGRGGGGTYVVVVTSVELRADMKRDMRSEHATSRT
jgi:hypothetical protein